MSEKDGFERFRDESITDNPAYNWPKRLSKRNLLNTYVWTAAGGMHTEQESVMDSYTESYSGISSSSFSLGFHLDAALAAIGGVYGEADMMWGTNLEVTSTRSSEKSSAFSLEASVATDGFLKRPLLDNAGQVTGFSIDLAPGKVDAYRFMTIYQAPEKDNFDLFQQVIDQNWLRNSTQANAAALREATANENGVWRILHRVTYVSRIPPKFQPVPTSTLEPDFNMPVGLEQNTWLTRLIESQINSETPTAVQIGNAIRLVLGTSSQQPGILGSVLPWWVDFHKAAEVDLSEAMLTFIQLQEDLLGYMIDKYEAQTYEKQYVN